MSTDPPIAELLRNMSRQLLSCSDKVYSQDQTIERLSTEVAALQRENSMLKAENVEVVELKRENVRLHAEIASLKNDKDGMRKEIGRLSKLQSTCSCKNTFKSPTFIPTGKMKSPLLKSTPNLQQTRLSFNRSGAGAINLLQYNKSTTKRTLEQMKTVTPVVTSPIAVDTSLATTVDPGDSMVKPEAQKSSEEDDSLASTVDDEADTQPFTQENNSPPPQADDEVDDLAATVNPDATQDASAVSINHAIAILEADPDVVIMETEPAVLADNNEVFNNHDPSPVIRSRFKAANNKPDDSYDMLPQWREREKKQPCVEVVRKKADRRHYHGIDCAECAEYYALVGGDHREISSRHRSNQQLPATPDGFWDLSWHDDKPGTSKEVPNADDAGVKKLTMNRRRQPFKLPANYEKAKLREAIRISQSPAK